MTDAHARYLIGDVFETLRALPPNSVDLVLSSPPFLGLRSYLPDADGGKQHELGSEESPAAFLDVMLAVVAECERVLGPRGSLVFELGDTYSGSGGAGGDYADDGWRDGQPKFRQKHNPDDWPLPKSLCGIPWLFALSMAYGRNLLTGASSPSGQWRVRNVIAWCRPNPPVGALGDKFRPATSYLTVATKAKARYFDMDAVRVQPKSGQPGEQLAASRAVIGYAGLHKPGSPGASTQPHLVSHPNGAPPLDYWVIATHPYAGAHFATWPPELCTRPILSMCPQWVCRACGKPRERITTAGPLIDQRGRVAAEEGRVAGDYQGSGSASKKDGGKTRQTETVGWSDCGHDDYRRGVVLDPFAGSGTTLAVATGLGRDAIGIDLDARNAFLAERRVGMFLTVEIPFEPLPPYEGAACSE